jgi:uncharacterized protein YmfQ (DUF2313 family)
MKSPVYRTSDFLQAMQALMPRGRVWPRDADAVQTKVLTGLSAIYERSSADAVKLLADAFPSTAYSLLPEWESALGLPSACTGVLPTVQARQGAVKAKFAGTGGQSLSYYIGFAANLGYPITITQHAPFRCGASRMGSPLGDAGWFFVWTVNAPTFAITSFATGKSAMGEPLRSWDTQILPCALAELAPAHTILQFNYA